MWKDSTQIFFELFVLCRDNMVPYQDADYKLPKHTGQPGWSLIYVAFSDIYFIELFKLSCDHMSLFRLNHVVCWSILLCFFTEYHRIF